MMDLEKYLYDKIVPIIQSWNEKDIYAVSFFVYTNERYVYEGITNFPEVSVGYNTEKDCNGASLLAEERWNFAFWRQNNETIIDSVEAADGAEFLLNWYRSKGIDNIGFEDFSGQYDENMNYIGKGPVGYYELLCAVSNVAKRIQKEGIIADKFGHIPVIVHELEYSWYVEEATRNANPGGEADAFLAYLHGILHADFPGLQDDFSGEDEAGGELADSENTDEIEAFLTSLHNAEINSSDDAMNVIDKLLPLMADEDEIDDIHNVLGDFFAELEEMEKDTCDDADTE